jgi:hypothetical protein
MGIDRTSIQLNGSAIVRAAEQAMPYAARAHRALAL